MLCAYHYFCFTDFVDDPQARYYVGYSLILVTIINVGVNILIMVLQTSAKLWLHCKRLFKRYKALRLRMKQDTDMVNKQKQDPYYDLI